MSTQINMDDPLAPPGPKDVPPGPREPAAAGEPAPKRRGRPKGDAQLKLDLKEIEDKLATLLETPAIPMAVAGDVWPAQHIEQRAKPLAKAISQACKDNPQLREKLLQYLRVGDSASLILAVGVFLVPILIYYGILPAPPIVKIQLQIPDRQAPGVRQASVPEQVRIYEQQMRDEAEAHGERYPAGDGTPVDPENPRQTPSSPRTAQARTPPAI